MRRLWFSLPLLVLPLFGCAAPNPILAAISCPRSAVLYQASTVTRFAPGTAQVPANAVATANISDLEMVCELDFEQNASEIDMRFVINTRRGPAAQGNVSQTFPYFVTVLGPGDQMLSKELFQQTVNLGNQQAVNTVVTVTDTVLRMAPDTQIGQYQILIGFQLTPEELAYNTSQRNSPAPPPAP